MMKRTMKRRLRKILLASTIAILGATTDAPLAGARSGYAETAAQTPDQPAKDFKFEGVTFATSLTEFKNRHPDATNGPETDLKIKLE